MGTIEKSYITENEETFDAMYNSDEETIEFKVNANDVERFVNISKIKEYLYQSAIQNLVKKTNFLQLYIQLIEDQISEKQYEQELSQNSEKYFIHMEDEVTEHHVHALFLILKKIKNNFSIDEVSEVFGIQTDSLLKSLN